MKYPLLKLKSIGTDKWSAADKTVFFKTIGDLISTGFSLNHALSYICETEPKLSNSVTKINQKMETGAGFSVSIREFIDSETYHQILVAEKHGQLGRTLSELGSFFDIRQTQMKKIQGLLTYPVFLMAMIVILVVTIKLYILPNISGIYVANNHHNQTPYLLFLGVLLIGVLGYFGWFYWTGLSVINRFSALSKLPVIGKVVRSYLSYYLASNLAVLLRNGLPIKAIIELLKTFDHHSLLYNLGGSLNRELKSGTDIVIVAKNYDFVPKEMIKFLNSGGTTDEIAQSLLAYSQKMFQTFSNRIDRLIGCIQPILFCVIGLAIVAAYFQILMPIYGSLKEIY